MFQSRQKLEMVFILTLQSAQLLIKKLLKRFDRNIAVKLLSWFYCFLPQVHKHVSDCISKGAVARTGGSAAEQLNSSGGCFYLPTVLDGCTEDMHPFTDETFGPVVPFMRFSTDDEAIRIANDTK